MKIKRALVSVSNKVGLIKFVDGLSNLGIEIISTGGTAQFLRDHGIKVKDVSKVTNFPEILDGRVKTLHPMIHAGILARRDLKEHMDTLKKYNVEPIDLICVNLYPFEETIEKKNVSFAEIIENIDIGGPTLIRAGAKNYRDVIVVTKPEQYDIILKSLKEKKDLGIKERRVLALEAFDHVAVYDAVISNYLREKWNILDFPDEIAIGMKKIQDMRYGENPHLKASFYITLPKIDEPCIAKAIKLQGKELSYNNILDADCAIECVKEFDEPTCVIVKHATPCGIASSNYLLKAWKDAYATDTYSPYGGIVAFNRKVDLEVAREVSNVFLEVIVAPDFNKKALELLSSKKNLRLLKLTDLQKKYEKKGISFRSVVGGCLIQSRDVWFSPINEWKFVTKKKPSKKDLETMLFAVKCVKHIKSNGVVFVKDKRTVGIGGGQTSRVDAVWIATYKGKESIRGSTMASDAFFPFRDAVDAAAEAGVRAIVQPGGSIRDKEVIEAADEHGIIMVFTGQRYFRH